MLYFKFLIHVACSLPIEYFAFYFIPSAINLFL